MLGKMYTCYSRNPGYPPSHIPGCMGSKAVPNNMDITELKPKLVYKSTEEFGGDGARHSGIGHSFRVELFCTVGPVDSDDVKVVLK